jgi:subtilisin family serine protease
MISLRPIVYVLLVAVAACAPAATGAPPAAPSPAPAAEAAAPTTAPARWWHLDPADDGVHGAAVDRAYAELLAGRQPARTVVVAIIDSGVDVQHEDLHANVWQNPGEVAGTGRDDDGNGYPDDIHGWNFIGGPDGRNVRHDTYEVTRLYVALGGRFQGARPDTLSPAARREYDRYLRVRDDFRRDSTEAAETLARVRTIRTALEQVTSILQAHLGTRDLTVERVSVIRSMRQDVIRARDLYVELTTHEITPEVLEEAIDEFEKRLAYGYNPQFDPRPLVGDDYADPRERFYGNSEVGAEDPKHGTMVAGIIAAVRDDVGIDGIAPAVRIMAIRAVPDGDERDKDVANAIRYAADNGAHIINMSFGKGYSPRKEVVDDAVRYAESRGILLIHAAGNDGKDLDISDNYPNRYFAAGDTARLWLTVGATGWEGGESLPATFSNYGRTRVDLFAPGVDLRSTAPGNAYDVQSGTSFAAPVVTGVAALLMAYHPELGAEDVRSILLESATRLPGRQVVRPGSDTEYAEFCDLSVSCGIVNAFEALRLAAERSASMN